MDVRLPDGTIIRNIPESTTKADLVERLKRNGMAVPSEWMADSRPRVKQEKIDPADGMSTTEKVLAGAGKGLADVARGIGQAVGLVSEQDIKDSRDRDAALMNTGAGQVGAVIGTAAPGLAAALVPGANTVVGSAATGALMGALQPVAGDESRLGNAAMGGAAGAAGVMAVRGAAGLVGAAKGLAEPFTEAGRARIAGRVLERFADDPSKILAAKGAKTATGAMPTLAEETGDAGLARLQDALRSLDPQIAGAIGQRLADNNAARVAAIQSLAGDSAKRAAAEGARAGATKPLYDAAVSQTLEVDDVLRGLMQRPSVQKAMSRAQSIAAEEGRSFGLTKPQSVPASSILGAGGAPASAGYEIPAKVSGRTLQDLKMGLDALLKDPTSGIAGKEAANIRATRDAIVGWMEQKIPEFQAARTTFAATSKPINGMEVGEYLANKATSNTSDLAGNPRMQANALLSALRDEAGLIKKATGRSELKSLSQVFDPQQMATLKAVASEADRAAAVASAGAGPGSATAQRMASQNILRQIAGPAGLPESWVESTIANTVLGKPLNLVYGGVAEPKIQQALAKAVLSPSDAKAVLEAAQRKGMTLPDNLATRLARTAGRASLPAASLVSGER